MTNRQNRDLWIELGDTPEQAARRENVSRDLVPVTPDEAERILALLDDED
jgi:hypothetical protein